MNQILLFFMIIFSFFLQKHHVHAMNFSDLQMTGVAHVTHIIDPQTLQLDDGRIIALVGLDQPYIYAREDSPLSLLTIKILDDMLKGQQIKIYQTRKEIGRLNRMGHHLAHIERDSDNQWVQGMILSLGLARVRTTAHNREMASARYRIERLARAEEMGSWEGQRLRLIQILRGRRKAGGR